MLEIRKREPLVTCGTERVPVLPLSVCFLQNKSPKNLSASTVIPRTVRCAKGMQNVRYLPTAVPERTASAKHMNEIDISKNILKESIRAETEYRASLDTYRLSAAARTPHPLLVTGLPEGARAAFYAAFLEDAAPGSTALFLVPDEKEALALSNALLSYGLNAMIYPFRDLMFHNITASHEFEHERLRVLSAIRRAELGDTDAHGRGKADAVIATPDAALQFTIPPEVLRSLTMTLAYGDEREPETVVEFLNASGYVRTDTVDGVGQYAVRGGIMDIYPPFSENPFRVEFFGNEIDQMGIFDPLTQRKIENVKSVRLPPAREVLISAEMRGPLVSFIRENIKKCAKESVRELLSGEAELLKNGMEISGVDKYISFLYPQKCCLLDYFANTDGIFAVQESGRIGERLSGFEWHAKEGLKELLESGAIPAKYAEYHKWPSDLAHRIEHSATILCDAFPSGMQMQLAGIFSMTAKQTVSYADKYELLCEDLRHYIKNRYRILVLAETETMTEFLKRNLFDDDISAVGCSETLIYTDMQPGVPVILYTLQTSGYELPLSRFTILSLQSVQTSYGRAAGRLRRRKKKRSSAERILSYNDLEIGDFVVHETHGIGRYMGLENLTDIDGNCHDHVKIAYAGSDCLYLPCDRLDLLSKYIGARAEDGSVRLSKLGGTEWGKTKARVRAAAKDMAKELIQLYAQRLRKEGFACAADDEMQREFENAFPYEETESQLTSAEEIKRDMEKKTPMDRLLCGDVGYGKTEVALRAAFKAVANGKQAAILVPTTLLAMQHYQTILSRMRGFPVKADLLSRFRTSKQQAESLRRLRRGETDIIVGTHRLLSKDVVFKQLGLVVIDEEQRFGVVHKEKLKQMTENVDVLTLTATPIPRTLNMAMSGIRDMSLLEEGPGDRVPIQTYVLEYDDLVVGEAIRRELRRGGQVFWLHNRVENIESTAAQVSALAPDAKIAVAHGKMDKEEINDIWQSLLEGEVDILISTTIIETGVDVPNANTLIIENADRMGLSQLHQIRGRIGRSGRRAYAYFTYSRGKILSEIAAKRLAAIREYTEFGSGFKIAMRDLEIRGAGSLLGSAQHGHMESVGYDLYIKLLNEAILEERGEKLPEKTESLVSMKCDAYIPEKYVRSSSQRMELYKKIASIEEEADLRDVEEELYDRFGEPPRAAKNLLYIAYLRALSQTCRFRKVEQKEGTVYIYPEILDFRIWSALSAENKKPDAGGKIMISMGEAPYVSYRLRHKEGAAEQLCSMFKKYIQLQSENL